LGAVQQQPNHQSDNQNPHRDGHNRHSFSCYVEVTSYVLIL
jgi:hypothetical protein